MIGYQFLLEIDALNAANVAVTLRFCCKPVFTTSGYTWNPAAGEYVSTPCAWQPYIIDPGLFQVNLFSGSKLTGPSSYSYGEIILCNLKNIDEVSGPIDWLYTYKFYGRPVRMYVGLQSASFQGGFTQQYAAAIESMRIETDTISFTLRGRQAELDVPISTTAFLGNNSAPMGYEGDASLKDKLKPILIGRAINFTPVLVNSSKLIYAVSPFTVKPYTGFESLYFGAGLSVYDNGVEIYNAGQRSALETNDPAPGQFYTNDWGGYFRLGSPPVGTITCSAVTYRFGLNSHPKNLVSLAIARAEEVVATYVGLLSKRPTSGVNVSETYYAIDVGLFYGCTNSSPVTWTTGKSKNSVTKGTWANMPTAPEVGDAYYVINSGGSNGLKICCTLHNWTHVDDLSNYSTMFDSDTFTSYSDFGERGLYITDSKTVSSIIDELVAPLGYWYFTHTGALRFGKLADPSSMTPVYTLQASTNITSFSTAKSQDTRGGIPAKKVTVKYARNYTIQDLQTNVPTSWKQRVSRDNEYLSKSSALAALSHPLSEELILTTAKSSVSDTDLDLLRTLFCTDRNIITVGVITTEFLTASALLPGQCVHVDLEGRFGYTHAAPKHMIILGITLDYVKEIVSLILWG